MELQGWVLKLSCGKRKIQFNSLTEHQKKDNWERLKIQTLSEEQAATQWWVTLSFCVPVSWVLSLPPTLVLKLPFRGFIMPAHLYVLCIASSLK